MNIFKKFDIVNDLTDNEKVLIQYIKDHPQDFIKMNTNQISQSCYVSVSTIYRLCHKLDLNVLSHLKAQVLASLDNYHKEIESFDYNFPITQNETQYQIVHKIKEVYQQTMTSTLNLFDLEQLRLSANLLKKQNILMSILQQEIYTSLKILNFKCKKLV